MKNSHFIPDFMFHRVWEITPEFLRAHGIRGLILDIDNTLAMAEAPEPHAGVEEWLMRMKKEGIRLVFLSNNTKKRVRAFTENVEGIPSIAAGFKPLRWSYLRACEALRLSAKQTAMIGDQIFTDVAGANRLGILTILVEPFSPKNEDNIFWKAKRKLEKRFIAAYHAYKHTKNKEKGVK